MQNNWRGGASALVGEGCGDERVQIAISSYLDGEADPTERAMAEWHLAECRQCQLLVAGWSQDTARLKFAAHDQQVSRIVGAITSQTRYALRQPLAELIGPKPVKRPSGPVFAPRVALGLLAAVLTIFVSVLGLGLSSFSGPDTAPLTVGATVPMVNNALTYAVTSPTSALRLEASVPATPSIAAAIVNLGYSQAVRASAVRSGLTPTLNYYPATMPPTPSVILTRAAGRG